jgi:hypothetical protein
MTRPPSAAQALFPNLKTGTPDVVQQRHQGTVADAMYSHLKPPPSTPPNPYRDSLLKHLRELNRQLRRERGSRSWPNIYS